MEYHEIANIFPMMNADEYMKLKADIADNGFDNSLPIITLENKILDGRNRYRACKELYIDPVLKEFEGEDPFAYVVRTNLHRRHLNETQRGIVANKLANMKQGERNDLKPFANLQKVISQPKAAQMLNVSPRTVATVRAVEKKAPELMPMLESGKMTANEAYKEIKKKEREEYIDKQVEEIQSNKFLPPLGTFEVIVIDPPWQYGTKYDPDGRRAANPYPEMSLEEIGNINLPASDDCILWLWTTHKFMRHSFDLLDKWGFRDVAIVTWIKNRMGLGSWLRSQSEFCIMAVKGSPKVNLTNQTTIVYGAMREHSRKPDEFYEFVDGLCTGYKLDYFSREKRDGWVVFGNDTEKFL